MEDNTKNTQKRDQYREMISNLHLSINHGFYMQAIFIEYSILEDRASTIIRVLIGEKALIPKSDTKPYYNLEEKIDKIEKFVNNNTNDRWLKNHLNEDLWNRIREWKKQRNAMVHALMNKFSTNEEMKDIAVAGDKLVYDFKTLTNNVKDHQKAKLNKQIKKKNSTKTKKEFRGKNYGY